ncbi:ribbon-helix-helix protein, CopG family [Halobacterium salinarum]|uniref:CopG domain protein n=1 Tax=Halobacterium salinarum (strain ATCC 33171 / DSM 3754 / JCM 8978 / NBRC 102687 / NCIMB 764 / 91-R6) TaxID=2597657 RepID=A0A4D6GVI2_HALS9|nr:ribbon-helix-helix protein, CopG family [Halobacterium salinarum]MDL0122046.1 ribbon-helix-helix protein, CopG family [Halobacterium salinarum]MDL0144773.1 ribbon-helix-helix protein, CopG family [Halobacterium salinarum]QCC45789.1 CopG domain protein [Halobacterium salinarum]TYO82047.1 Ribbon-helix-helix protein, copG family [Halobacterium salinarum DSM 3754]
MGNKNKTISFRVNEEAFDALSEIAEERNISLSAVFRDYVDSLVTHDGKVRVVPEDSTRTRDGDDDDFPPTVEVSKSFVREHERLELEAEHLREQLDEQKAYIDHLRSQTDSEDEIGDVVKLEELDDDDEPYQLG